MPSESKLLQAEAALRNWVAGDPDALYKAAICLSMQEQKEAYGVSISEQRVNDYLAQNLFANAASQEEKLEVLGNEYWVTTFMNGYESYANWRRTGYPKLFKVQSNTGKVIDTDIMIRRLPFSTDAATADPALYATLTEKLGGADNGATRLWWDTGKNSF